MADIFDIRKQAKDWLSKMFVPKDISLEGLQQTGIGQAASMAGMSAQPPGVSLGLAALTQLMKTKAGKEVQQMMDATGPLGGGIDDVVMASAKAVKGLPALGVVAPMFSNLRQMKPRGVPATAEHMFHSKLAEAIDRQFIAPGKPEDLLSIQQVKDWMKKLPGMGVKKEEIEHFNLNESFDVYDGGSVPGKISKKDLANYIDDKMPAIAAGPAPPNEEFNFSEYVTPGGENYGNYFIRSVEPDGFRGKVPRPGEEPSDLFNPRMIDSQNSSRGHWETPNILAHIRATDRTLPNGDNTLFVEEAQSDWAQNPEANFPLPKDYSDLVNRFLYKQAAKEGKDSVTISPASVHQERWNGSLRNYEPHTPLSFQGFEDLYRDGRYANQELDPKLTNLVEAKKAFQINLDKLTEMKRIRLEDHPFNSSERAEARRVMMQDPEYKHLMEQYRILGANYDTLQETIKNVELPATNPYQLNTRFKGFDDWYNRRMPNAAQRVLKDVGSESGLERTSLLPTPNMEFSETALQNAEDVLPEIESMHPEWFEKSDPIQRILDKYRDNYPPPTYVQPSQDTTMPTYKVDPSKVKNRTFPLWMGLGAVGIDRLRNGERKD